MGIELNYIYLCLDRFRKSAEESREPIDTAHEIEIHKNMTTKNDILVALAEAREDAREKALAEGEARGIEKGKAEGEAIGFKKGKAEGEAKGLEKGKAEGITEGKVEVARAMLKKNSPIDFIASVTGLTEEQVRNL